MGGKFRQVRSLQLGFHGDRTERLWCIEHGALENLSPKVAVIMIGTNNTGHGRGIRRLKRPKGSRLLSTRSKNVCRNENHSPRDIPESATANDRMRKVNEEINEMLPGVAKRKERNSSISTICLLKTMVRCPRV